MNVPSIMFMDTLFKHDLALLTRTGACTPIIHGLMRRDETAAILAPEHKRELNDAFKLRYYRTALDIREYIITGYYRDTQRPLTKWLIKPIVVQLSKSFEHLIE